MIGGACTDWTGKTEKNRPNCLIIKRLRLLKVQADLGRFFLVSWELGKMIVSMLLDIKLLR
jgi:hypothetical protein